MLRSSSKSGAILLSSFQVNNTNKIGNVLLSWNKPSDLGGYDDSKLTYNISYLDNTPGNTYSYTVNQVVYDDLKFFLAQKNTPYSRKRYALAFEPSANLLKIYLPATTTILERDLNMAIGIAAGYVNVIASILGYATGCCACFDGNVISKIIGGTEPVILLMGVGFKNPEVNRRVHHMNPEFMFPALKKQPILVNRIK